MINIIQGNAHDVGAIMPVMNDAFDQSYGEAWTSAQCLSLLALPGSKLLIARHAGDVAGFAMTRWVLDEEELMMIGVAKANQRRDIGAQILNTVIEQAIAEGRKKLFLEVRKGNEAEYFYQSAGFEAVGIRKDYYKGAHDIFYSAITMVRMLQ